MHDRTARDWRDGIRKIGNTRVLPDGTVIDYTTGTRYTRPVITTKSRGMGDAAVPEVSDRFRRCRTDSRSQMVCRLG